MQPTGPGRPATSTNLRRYGPLGVIVVLLVVVGAIVLAGGGDDGGDGEASDGTGLDSWTSVEGVEAGAPAPTGSMPVTYDEAKDAGNLDDHQWGDDCDTERGRLKVPSVFALPCVPAFDGDNGGETSPGVTADSIKVVYYAPEQSADLTSILGGMGANDSADQRVRTLEDYVELFSSVSETYGRDIELERFAASGAADDVVAARADALDVIAMEPFAVLGGPALDRGTFAQELAEAGIPCYECAGVLPDNMVLDLAPYVWGTMPSPNQFLGMLNAWTDAGAREMEEQGADDVAAFAGGDLKDKPRKTGVIHFEQDPPIYGETTAAQEERYGDQVAINESYVLDLPNMPAKAAELIARYKSEGITTIVFLGDPFMPTYLTAAATQQDYYPEWVFTGTALTDTNVMARQYDPKQMEHAYGISQLAAPTDQELQEAMSLYRWYFGDGTEPPAPNQYALLAPPAQWLMAGIHMAGPDLTPETFARGMFRIPPSGGGPSNPSVSYGNWGVFPDMDYNGIDDAVEIWWDPTVEAEDERGVMGTGAWRRSNGGERFTIDGAPPPAPFDRDNDSITIVHELSDEDRTPAYPSPAGSPAAAA
jgi:hypothetical protein